MISRLLKRRAVLIIAVILLVLFAILMAYSIGKNITSDNSTPPVTTSVAAPKPTLPREVQSIATNDKGELVITYSDGTTDNAGRVVGQDGTGQLPTQAQVSAAVAEYCSSGVCDARQPSTQEILDAIEAYCANGICRGQDGTNAKPITAEQIFAAVNSYCSDGKCRGPAGQSVKGDTGATGAIGATGPRGESTQLGCVVRTSNGTTTRYVSYKYPSEPDTAYRDVYKLPVWAECVNPVTL